MNGDTRRYWSLQGTVDLFDRVNGMPQTGMWLGDCSSIEYNAEPQKTDFKENWSGSRTIGLSMYQGVEASLAITMHQVSSKSLELLFGGDLVAQSTAAVVDKVISGTTLTVGDVYLLGAYDVSALTIEDSTPTTPITLTLNTHYRVDAKTGRVELLDVTTGGPLVGPLKASFTPGTVSYVKMLTNTEREKWIHITSKNTAVTGMPRMAFDFYDAKLLPSSFQFINEERGEAVLNCTIIGDPTKTVDGDLGIFGRAVMLD